MACLIFLIQIVHPACIEYASPMIDCAYLQLVGAVVHMHNRMQVGIVQNCGNLGLAMIFAENGYGEPQFSAQRVSDLSTDG